jgi:hypothetical protein
MNIGKLVRGAFATIITAGMLLNPFQSLAQHTSGATSVYNFLERNSISTTLYGNPKSADLMLEHVVYNHDDKKNLTGSVTRRTRAEDFDNDGDADLIVVSIENYVAGQGTTTNTARFYRGPEFVDYELSTIGQFRNGCRLEDGRTRVQVIENKEGRKVYAVDMAEQSDLYNLQAISENGVSISNVEAMIQRLIREENEADIEEKTNTASEGFLLTGWKSNPTVDQIAALRDIDIPEYAVGAVQQKPYRCNGGLLPGFTDITGIYEDPDFSIVQSIFETVDGIAEEYRTFAELEESGRLQDIYLTNGEAVFASGDPINDEIKDQWKDDIEDALNLSPEILPGVWSTTYTPVDDVQPNT